MYVCIYIERDVCMYMCIYIWMYIYIYVHWYIYRYMFIYLLILSCFVCVRWMSLGLWGSSCAQTWLPWLPQGNTRLLTPSWWDKTNLPCWELLSSGDPCHGNWSPFNKQARQSGIAIPLCFLIFISLRWHRDFRETSEHFTLMTGPSHGL